MNGYPSPRIPPYGTITPVERTSVISVHVGDCSEILRIMVVCIG